MTQQTHGHGARFAHPFNENVFHKQQSNGYPFQSQENMQHIPNSCTFLQMMNLPEVKEPPKENEDTTYFFK